MKSDDNDIVTAIERWAELELRPIAKKFDHADEYPTDIVEQMKGLGLFGATIHSDYGGLGLSASTYARVVMAISSVWMAPVGIFNSHLIMAACVQRHGTDKQKRQWLPKFASGEIRGGIGLTEPNAGTDLQSIRTVARRDGDHYVLNGTKTWITNGVYGSCFGDGNIHEHNRLPLFMAGLGNGALKGNLHYRAPRKTPMSNALLTVLQGLGIDIRQFGDSTGTMPLA